MARIHPWLMVCCPLVLVACSGKDGGGQDSSDTAVADTALAPDDVDVDEDEDGFSPDEGDCDDSDPRRYPGAEEECNGIDDDCNDVVDDDYPDTDEDGTADCVDEEECDGLDNDGDGLIDEDFDVDGDGLADCLEETDCDGVDDDDDGVIDDGFDADGDGYTVCGDDLTPPDCNDEDPDIHPDAPDVADEIDNDCDRLIDEDLWSVGDLVINEIMANPELVPDNRGEWFEIVNVTERSVVLNGIEITSGGESHIIEDADRIVLEPGAFFVFGLSDSVTRNGNVPVDYAYRDVSFTDDLDALALFVDGLLLDNVTWNEADGWVPNAGASWSLDPAYTNGLLNDDPGFWCAGLESWAEGTDLGSPAAVNPPCEAFDHDGDGFSGADGDCDDLDARVYPGAPEVDAGIDNDCDGTIAVMPVAWADYDTTTATLSNCDTLQLDGTRSYDPDGGSLSYSWSVDTVPDGSAATTDTLVSPTDARPTLEPDLAGDYAFSLVVNDGTFDSSPSRLTLTIHDPDVPTLSAGPDQSHADSVMCDVETGAPGDPACPACAGVTFSLSADLASDPTITSATWEVVSDWTSLSIDDTASAEPHVTVWDLQPSSGETVSAVAEVFLHLTDCTGRTTSTSLSLDVSCEGIDPASIEDTGGSDTGLSTDTGE